MRWRVEHVPGVWIGVRWRVNGALRDVWIGLVFGWELHLWWEHYGTRPVLSGRGTRWWYWALVLALILVVGWLVAVGRL